MRESSVFYASWFDAIQDLPAEQYKECMEAVRVYAFTGEETADTAIAKMFLTMAKPLVDKNNQRRENGINGGRPKTKQEPNDNQTEPSDNQTEPNYNQSEPNCEKAEPNENETVNVNVNETVTVTETEKRERRAARTPFRRPTIEEIQEYCTERGNRVDPQTFFDFYESKGWRVGSQPMKDWRAAVRTWEKREETAPPGRSAPAKKPNRFNDVMEKHSYSLDDIAALERFNADRNARIAEEYYKKQRGATA